MFESTANRRTRDAIRAARTARSGQFHKLMSRVFHPLR